MNRVLKEKLVLLTMVFLTITAILCIMEIKDELIVQIMKGEKIFIPDVIIDAGHGGMDGGAVSSNGVSEADINLSISRKAHFISSFIGIKSEMTRCDRESLDYEPSATIRQNKMNDLKARVEIGKQYESAEYISIHLNKFSDPRYYGAQVFHKSDPASVLMAQKIQGSLYLIDESNTRSFRQIPNDNYIFERIQNTGVIVECGFLSNANEELMLQNDAYQSKLAILIMSGYTNYKYNR